MTIDSISSRISIRGLQVMGAICVSRFCASQGIRHRCVDAFVRHLWKIATAEDIMEWWWGRVKLELPGRGDPLPDDLAEMLDEPLRGDFHRLVTWVGEISEGNMFCQTDMAKTRRCLLEAFRILERYGVTPPEQTLFEKAPRGLRGWGRPVWPEVLRQWKELC